MIFDFGLSRYRATERIVQQKVRLKAGEPWNALKRVETLETGQNSQRMLRGIRSMSKACRIILPSCSTANVCSLKVCQVWQRLRQAPLSCAHLSHWRRETRMPRMTDAQQKTANAPNASLVLLRSIKTLYPHLFRCHLNVTPQPHLCQSMSFVLDVFLIFSLFSYAFFGFVSLCVLSLGDFGDGLCPFSFCFSSVKRSGPGARSDGCWRADLRGRSRARPAPCSFFSNRKNKQNSIIQIIQIIQSISKIFKVHTVCSSLWSL